MLKSKMLNKINTNPCEVLEVLGNMNKQGKTYLVVKNETFKAGFRKTLKGAQALAEKSVSGWYDDTQDRADVIEISENELTDYSSDVQAWYEFFLNNPSVGSYYTEMKFFLSAYVDDFFPLSTVRMYIEEQYQAMKQGLPPVDPSEITQVEDAAEEVVKQEEMSANVTLMTDEIKISDTEMDDIPVLDAEVINVVENIEKKGLELYFKDKPSAGVIQELKDHKFRWHKTKKCWYAKATVESKQFVEYLKELLNEQPVESTDDVQIEPGEYTLRRTDSSSIDGSYIYNQIIVIDTKLEPYAQYQKSLRLTYVNRGERKQRVVRFVRDMIEFYSGWNGDHTEVGLPLVATFENGYNGFINQD